MSEQITQAADSVQLNHERRGAGSPLLFIHGLTFDRSTWEPIVEQLADRFTCVAVDLPGHGGSDGPQRGIDDVVLAISHRLGELEVEAPVVIGHSMGAAVAGTYAAHHPARGLVMVDQAPYVRPFAAMLHQLEPALRSKNFRAAFEPIRQTIGVELLPEPQRTSILKSQRIDQDLVLSYWDGVLATTPDELQARIDRETKTLALPVLAVFGQTIDAATREHLLSHLPSAEIEEWAGLGHMVHLMEPERFARRLGEFAERCFRPQPETPQWSKAGA
jgi:pimeloyl-ACP methyl ester carboxylesterase